MTGKSHSDTLAGFTLNTAGFPDFHNRIATLRFPVSVAEVLELRDLIHHSVDVYEEPPDIPQNREFRDSLENAVHTFGIDNPHHSDRLVRILTMLRGMHYHHTIVSRDTEQNLRQRQAENREKRRVNLRSGVLAVLVTIALGTYWAVTPFPDLALKLGVLVSAILAFAFIHALPRLDAEMERLTRELNDVLRKRVDSLNWRTMIHKLSLLLGYKQIQGIEVFKNEQADSTAASHYLH